VVTYFHPYSFGIWDNAKSRKEDNLMNRLWITLLFTVVGSDILLGQSKNKEAERLEASARVFQEIMDTPDSAIPNELLSRCECISIIPSMKKGGFIVGGRYGKGAVSCRKGNGKGPWGPPAMITVEGGSFGLQIGGAAVDVVMLFMDKDGVSSLLKDKFTLGADASAAAGPVGRDATAGTDVLMKAKILSYSRSRGAFAGLELKGAVVKQDKEGNRTLYGKDVDPKDLVLAAKEAIPRDAQPLIQILTKYAPVRQKKPL